jgi:membrane protein
MRFLRDLWLVLRQAFAEWKVGNVPRLGAALAYYSVFSIPALLILGIAIASMIFGREAAQHGIVHEIEDTVGAPVARAVSEVLANNSDPARSGTATVIGILILLVGAAAVFGELQEAMNTIWRVERRPSGGVWGLIRDRFLSMTMVLGSGFLLLVSLVVNTVLSAMSGWMSASLPGGAALWQAVNSVVSLVVITALFALIFKIVPDAEVAWQDVWIGALLTAILFTIGQFFLGWYLGQASTTSAYGAAGSLVVILLWVYYASQIVLFGAAFTRVYAVQQGLGVKPAANAVARDAAPREPGEPQAA